MAALERSSISLRIYKYLVFTSPAISSQIHGAGGGGGGGRFQRVFTSPFFLWVNMVSSRPVFGLSHTSHRSAGIDESLARAKDVSRVIGILPSLPVKASERTSAILLSVLSRRYFIVCTSIFYLLLTCTDASS